MNPGRWKVACINWSSTDAPHAIVYLDRNGRAIAERYFPTFTDAWAWLDRMIGGR